MRLGPPMERCRWGELPTGTGHPNLNPSGRTLFREAVEALGRGGADASYRSGSGCFQEVTSGAWSMRLNYLLAQAAYLSASAGAQARVSTAGKQLKGSLSTCQ